MEDEIFHGAKIGIVLIGVKFLTGFFSILSGIGLLIYDL
jgi:hypothetical protein